MAKQNVTRYSDAELSLLVLNTEPHYREFMDCESEEELRAFVERAFIFTEKQFAELLDDWRDRDE
ncbi:MAG: hypothetical protein R3322_00405 [Kiloniellales bacterium]|nr:hypothetical protein [Kiloniellales bacterium]